MTHATLRPEFEDLIDPYAPVGQVGTGFTFTEGPIWHPVDQYLLFSDMPADVRRRWDAARGVVEVRRPSNKCNGMTYDADLNLIVCEHATSSLVRERPDGRREVLGDAFRGAGAQQPQRRLRPLRRLDLFLRSLLWADAGLRRRAARAARLPGRLSHPSGGGAPQLLVDRLLFDQPNGLCFSPDEKLLYVNDTVQTLIRVFDVAADGSLSNGRIFASGIRSSLEEGVPDGMKCDQRGNVWVTAPGGVWVYAPSGDLLGKVRAPEKVANLAWGGPDFRTLFLTATHSVYRIETKVGPRREPYMGASAPAAAASPGAPQSAESRPSSPAPSLAKDLTLDPRRCALIIQDMQNDVISEGGAFAASGAPAHARAQNVVENVRRLAAAARARGVAVIHVWFVVEPGAPGLTLNAPLFEGVVDNKAMVRGGWGAAPVSGLEPQPGDFVVEKMRMSAWEGTRLETILKSPGPRHDHQHRRLDQHVGRAHRPHRRRQGLFHGRAGGLLLDDERRVAQRLDQLRAAECRRRHQRRRRHQGARMSGKSPRRWARP